MKQKNRRQLLAAMAAMAILVPAGGGIHAIDADHILASSETISQNNGSLNGESYWYGVVGGDTYMDNMTTDKEGNPVRGGLPGTVSSVNGIVSTMGGALGLNQSLINTVGSVNTVLQDKTEGANAGGVTTATGTAGLNLKNYGNNYVRYYGAVGGDLSVNTGLKGTLSLYLNEAETPLIKEAAETNIVRDGGYTNVIEGGSVVGGVGGSAAVALGNIDAKGEYSKTAYGITAKVEADVQLDGKTSTTVNGDVATNAGKDANLLGWMNGGLAAGLGGTAESTINGNSTLTIDGTGRDILGGADEKPGADDILPQVTTALNVMKGSGVNAIGVMGGGTAATTLGGEATSKVTGTSTINVNNATVLGAVGGGMAASIDATDIGDVLAKKLDPNHPPVGNDDGTADVSGAQLESWLGTSFPDDLKITAHDVNQGGTASSVTGDTYVTVTGDSTALGVLGGGAAVATHTYIGKTGDNKGKVVGASHASAATGKATITVNLPEKLQDGEKAAFMEALSGLKNGIATDSTQADVLKDMANKGAVGAVFGGGASLAYGSVATTGYEYNAEDVKGAEAKSETAGADINLVNGYAAGVMGGGIAGTRGNAYAESAMTDTVNINIGNFAETLSSDSAEAVGVFGNGLAYYTGKSDEGKKNLTGQALVTAKDTNINVAGMADGLIGGGMAIDDSQADRVNAKVQTTGTASINVYDGAKVSAINLDALHGLVGDVPSEDIDMASYVDGVKAAAGDAAIAAGGIALGGGASSEVTNAVVNIAGGEVTGNVYGGGIAAYGYAGQDGAENGGSRVDTSTINLTGGTVDGNVYAGGAAATKASDGATAVYGGYDKSSATVGTSTVNLAGTDVTGILYGTGTVDQKVVEETDTTAAQAAVDDSTLNLIGENTLSNVTVNSQESSKIQKFDNVNAAAGSVTKVTGITAGDSGTALIDGGKVTVADSAKLDISELTKATDAYHIAANTATDSTFWSDEQFVYDRTEGFATGNTTTESDKTAYDVTYKDVASLTDEEKAQAANSMAGALHAGPLQPTIQDAYNKDWDTSKGLTAGGKQFFSDWSKDQTGAAYGRGVMIGEDAAVTGNTVSIARDMADNVMQRLSFTDDYVQDAGWVNNDGGIWAKYIHRKYETDGMGSSFGGIHSSTDYDGAIVGVDFQKSGKFQSGIAFHYGSGDGDGVISHNDYDAWGFTLYGSMKDEEAHTNLMADIGYVTSDNDIDGTVAGKHMSADRDVDAWTIGLRGEKEYVFGQNQLVPYVGLRYMSVNPARYSVYYDGQKAFNADADNQNLWLLPIGVSFRNETKTDAGWRITPKLDLSYIWAFGDTDTDMTIDMGGVGSGLYYDVMDDNSWLASLGVEATKDVWSFGVGYGYQKGDDTKNKTWYVNASYAF